MKATASTEPYSVVNGEDAAEITADDPDRFEDDGVAGAGPLAVATQSPDLEEMQDRNETLGRRGSLHSKFLAAAFVLSAVAFGGREYYVRNYGGGGLASGGGGDANNPNGVRGSPSDPLNWDDNLGGDEPFEGDVDDKINNGEIGGLDSDVDNGDGDDGEEFSADANDEKSEDEVEETASDSEIVETEDSQGNDNVAEGESADGNEDLAPSASSDEDQTEEDSSNTAGEEQGEELPSASSDSGVAEDDGTDNEEEHLPEEEFAEGELRGEIPDYFVPLTPTGRDQLKERLRSTLRATKDALLLSGSGDGSINPNPQRTLVLDSGLPKQFMHMHHMKTGGTSLDGLISCALRRQKALNGTSIAYNRMSECGSRVQSCMKTLAGKLNASVVNNVFYQNDALGEAQVDTQFGFDPSDEALGIPVDDLNVCQTSDASVMSYCASLHAVRTFGWQAVDKVTVIRHPVDRAWSMYKFTLQRCYKCREMKDVLRGVANGTFSRNGGDAAEPNFAYGPNDSCAVQLIGHQATNLLSSVDLYNVANDVRFPREREIVDEAVRNLREVFTWIGVTDRIEESIDGMRTVFPFLAENLNDEAKAIEGLLQNSNEQVADGRFSLPEGYGDDKGCPFQHKNGGRDPTCGTKELDEETIYLIKKLTARDMAVYQAAVERFELQNEVLKEYRNGYL